MQSFSELGLAEPLARAIRDANYTTPTPIQAQAIPPLLAGHDLLGIAQTGTGKTAAFALPILDRLLREGQRAAPRHVRALILAPTRELAAQIADSFKTYGRHAGVSVGCVVGGVSPGPQVALLARGVDVLVATPGRLLDHMNTGKVSLSSTSIVVLDEADHMLDLGFVVPIRRIIAKLPRDRQNLFFSATMPREIAKLADEFLHDPIKVSVTPEATTVERITQKAYLIEAAAKADLLVQLLGDPALARTIVFTRTKRGADKVSRRLEVASIPSLAIHGNKSQSQRTRALDAFKAGDVRVLVATDIAARGIDIDSVTHVVNYELPDVAEAYVHRIGRTARAGADGAALSLVDGSEAHLLRAIEKATRQTVPVTDRRGTITPTRDVAARVPEHRDPRAQGKPRNGPGRTAQPAERRGERPRNGGGAKQPNGPSKVVWTNFGGADRKPAARGQRRDNGAGRASR